MKNNIDEIMDKVEVSKTFTLTSKTPVLKSFYTVEEDLKNLTVLIDSEALDHFLNNEKFKTI